MRNIQNMRNMHNMQNMQNIQNMQSMQSKQSQSVSPLSWFSDLDTSENHGYGDFSSFGSSSCFSIDICPDLVLGAITAAATAAGLLIYLAIVAAGRRKKREDNTFMSSIRELLNILGKLTTEYINSLSN